MVPVHQPVLAILGCQLDLVILPALALQLVKDLLHRRLPEHLEILADRSRQLARQSQADPPGQLAQ